MNPLITDFNGSTCRRDKKQSATKGKGGGGGLLVVGAFPYAPGEVVIVVVVVVVMSPCCQSKVAPVKISRNDNRMKTLSLAESLGTLHTC